MSYKSFFILICLTLAVSSCSEEKPGLRNFNSSSGAQTLVSPAAKDETAGKEVFITDLWKESLENAGLPDSIKERLYSHLMQGPDFVMELLSFMDGDPYLYKLVDKQHALGSGYVPDDLVDLAAGSYRVTRELTLRRAAAESLEVMAAAARADGVVLTAGSAFRTYDYQAGLYEQNVRELGQQAADRESARPGHSQHQLGLVVDFHPIEDSFAQTAESSWLLKNALRFGWSLSYPQGYEDITGYRWESWHYRYLGPSLAEFTEKYFDGIQQYALQFIEAWK